jgi:uncharacterized membrane protein YGL010W
MINFLTMILFQTSIMLVKQKVLFVEKLSKSVIVQPIFLFMEFYAVF